jgi:predicted transcriptional regulator
MLRRDKPILSIRIDSDLLNRVDDLAKLADASRAEVVERCLFIGLAHQEELVSWLKNPLAGPMFRFLTQDVILKAVGVVIGKADWTDPTTVKIADGVKKSRKGTSLRPKEL